MFKIREINIPGAVPPPAEKSVDAIVEPLPKPYQNSSFRMMIVGPSGSGKSNLFLNMLTRAYSSIFSNVWVYCPTFENDATLRKLTTVSTQTGVSFLDEEDVFMEADQRLIAENVLEKIKVIDGQFAVYKKDYPDQPLPKTLMVFDDLTNEIKDATFMKNLFTKGRKHEISIIIITNKYKEYSPQIRNNCTHFAFFKPVTSMEEKAIIQDICGTIDPASLKKAMDAIYIKAGHPFLYYNSREQKNKYWYMFDKPL